MAKDLTDILDRELVLGEQRRILWAHIENEWDLNGNSDLFNAMQAKYFLLLDEQEQLQGQIATLSSKAA